MVKPQGGVSRSGILLPLSPASLTHKKSQRHTKVHGTHPVGCKDQSIWRCFCRISCSCDFCGCCLAMHISFSLHCALQMNIFYLSGHKGPSIFNFGLIVFFTGTQWFWTGTHDLFTRWVPGLTITTCICNRITATYIVYVKLCRVPPPPPDTHPGAQTSQT